MDTCAFLSVKLPKTYTAKHCNMLEKLIKLSMLDAYRNSCGKFMSGFTNTIELWFAEQVFALQYNIPSIYLEAILPYQWHEMNYYTNPETCERDEHVIQHCLSKYIVSLMLDGTMKTRWENAYAR